MAYWWVSQNQTFRQERSGGYLWAPNRTEAGLSPFHWATMNEVRPGDLIFSYVGSKIVAVAVAKTTAFDSPRPRDMGEGLWEDEGKKIEVEYRDLPVPLPISDVLPSFQPILPERYSPLTRSGTGNQGYLFALPPRAGRLLLDRIGDQETGVVEAAISSTIRESTERRAVILSRVGQGQFREALMGLWGSRCAVTGLDLPLLLRASHIKPWWNSDNHERLDPYNGLLLSPSFDAAFDSGLVTFEESGRITLSQELTPLRTERLGVSPAAHITGLLEKHLAYLEYHRQHVFKA